jgi:hypothetical protein
MKIVMKALGTLIVVQALCVSVKAMEDRDWKLVTTDPLSKGVLSSVAEKFPRILGSNTDTIMENQQLLPRKIDEINQNARLTGKLREANFKEWDVRDVRKAALLLSLMIFAASELEKVLKRGLATQKGALPKSAQ